MEIFNSIILGAVQGLTEFIPISSSGHLIIVRDFLGINSENGLAFDAILHLATALAVLVYFKKEIFEIIKTAYSWILDKEIESENRNLLIALFLGIIPAVVMGFIFEDFISSNLRQPLVVAAALIAGSIIFWIAEQVAEKNRNLTGRRGFLVGLFQMFALIPGMSRSGITISGGLFLGLSREMATKFSFLLGFPIILGSGLKKSYDLGLDKLVSELGLSVLVGSITAFVFGIISMSLMIKYLKTHTLNVFVIYRIALAVIILFIIL